MIQEYLYFIFSGQGSYESLQRRYKRAVLCGFDTDGGFPTNKQGFPTTRAKSNQPMLIFMP